MSSIQAYKAHKQEGTLVSKVHKQALVVRHIFPSIPNQWLHHNCRICKSIQGYCKRSAIEMFGCKSIKATKIEKNSLVVLDMQWSHWCRDAWEDVPIECPLFVHLAYQCSFLFVCFVGLYAGHHIHLHFEIFLLAYLCTFLVIIFQYWLAAHALDTSPAHTCKEALPVASNSRLAILTLLSKQKSCVTSSRVQDVRLRYRSRLLSYQRGRITCVLLRNNKWRLTCS